MTPRPGMSENDALVVLSSPALTWELPPVTPPRTTMPDVVASVLCAWSIHQGIKRPFDDGFSVELKGSPAFMEFASGYAMALSASARSAIYEFLDLLDTSPSGVVIRRAL